MGERPACLLIPLAVVEIIKLAEVEKQFAVVEARQTE